MVLSMSFTRRRVESSREMLMMWRYMAYPFRRWSRGGPWLMVSQETLNPSRPHLGSMLKGYGTLTSLLENRPKIQAKSTTCYLNRY